MCLVRNDEWVRITATYARGHVNRAHATCSVLLSEKDDSSVNRDVIAVEMTENDKPPSMVIGYWMSDRKSQKLNWIEFGKVCRLDELFLRTCHVLSRFMVFCFIRMYHHLHPGHLGKTFRASALENRCDLLNIQIFLSGIPKVWIYFFAQNIIYLSVFHFLIDLRHWRLRSLACLLILLVGKLHYNKLFKGFFSIFNTKQTNCNCAYLLITRNWRSSFQNNNK